MNDDASGVILVYEDPDLALEEITGIVGGFSKATEMAVFREVFADMKDLFEGRFPGYRASNTKYHNFEHTVAVVLATARLLSGCASDGYDFSPRDVLLTLVASLCHDVGLIQEIDDTEGTGAKYTVGHEERGIEFVKGYLPGEGFTSEEIDFCADMIRCTILALSPSEVDFSSDNHRVLGYVVGAADLLAQMADRAYLEKLLLLYCEFEEARLPGFDSALDLLQKTRGFYEMVAKKRLEDDLGGVADHMTSYFTHAGFPNRDLYLESIEKHIHYLDYVIDACQDSFECYKQHLRRGGIPDEYEALAARFD